MDAVDGGPGAPGPHPGKVAAAWAPSPGRVALLASLGVVALQIFLLPAYYSTDFEVHRNWMAITHRLPAGQWYYDTTSAWTLDYPPLFAYMTWMLATAVAWAFPSTTEPGGLLDLVPSQQGAHRPLTVWLMRLSVLAVGDAALFAGAWALARAVCTRPARRLALYVLCITNAGLLMVDNIHFQYNAPAYGLLLYALALACQGRRLSAAVTFSASVVFKHIMVYSALGLGLWLLLSADRPAAQRGPTAAGAGAWGLARRAAGRLPGLALAAAGTCLAAFWPVRAHTGQILRRMFPVGARGIVHSYWAANVWALYCGAERVLVLVLRRVAPGLLAAPAHAEESLTRGLVTGTPLFRVLPTPTPAGALVVTLLLMLPSAWGLLREARAPGGLRPARAALHASMGLGALGAFLGAWHAHEKAILGCTVVLGFSALEPLLLGAGRPGSRARGPLGRWVAGMHVASLLWVVCLYGHAALWPLLFRPEEYLLKISLHLMHLALVLLLCNGLLPAAGRIRVGLLDVVQLGLLCALAHDRVAELLAGVGLDFLPLMLTSLVCAANILLRVYLPYSLACVLAPGAE